MFLLLTQVLLLLFLATLIYFVLVKLVPRAYLAWIGGVLLIILLILAFLNPYGDQFVSSVWNVLSFPLKPLGAVILLLFLGAIRIDNKGAVKAPGAALIWAALIILLLSSVPILAYQFAQQAELEAVQLNRTLPIDGARPGAIVLLGRGTTQANLPYRTQVQLTDTGDRILYTAQLYRQEAVTGNFPIVIVSAGPRIELEGNRNAILEANDIRTILISLGIPPEQIVVEPRGLDFYTSAVATEAILRQRGIRDRPIILVTSALNIRRATLTFGNQRLRVIPRPTNFYTFQAGATPRRRVLISDFIPSVEALLTTTRIIEEYFSSIYYFLRGWLTPVPF